jgi:nucleoside-diphosphate-sugar epimerase
LRKQGARIARIARANGYLGSTLKRVEEALRQGVRDGLPDQYDRHVIFSIDRARQVGFGTQTPLEDGIDASVRWARSQGLTA